MRLRLTALYGVLFFVSGAVLLAIAGGGFAVIRSSTEASGSSSTVPAPQSAAAKLASANALIRQLRDQLSAQAGTTQAVFSRDLLIASAIALGIMTLGSVAMGWILAGRALRPVRAMIVATQQISAHNLNERLAVAGPDDELKKLGDTIDGLLQRLEAAFNAQRRFVANASHELRTPLATIRASLDVAVAKPEGVPPQTIALAGRLRAELDRIDSLLEAFLVLARAQHRDLPGYAVLPLDYIVGAALADQEAAIRARNLTVQDRTGPGGAWVRGSQVLLSRMVKNLVDNAVCHNENGGWLQVTAQTEGERARLFVENGGQVLDPQQIDELFQPFRRLGADRIGILGERHRGGIVLPRLGQIAGLLRRFRRTKRGAETVRFLLQRRLVGGERMLGHAAVEQHRAIELARRREWPGGHRRLFGLVLGIRRGAQGL